MIFHVYRGDLSVAYEGPSWPMARAALDAILLKDEVPMLLIHRA